MCGSQMDQNIARILLFLDDILMCYQLFGMNLSFNRCDTVDHNIFAARKFRESAPMYIFATQNFRECAGTSTKKKKKPTNYAERSSRYNNTRSAMEALSLKLLEVSR